MANKKSNKSISKSNVVVGAVKKHKKKLWFTSLAVLLLLAVGSAGYVVWKGQSLKAKAENWSLVASGPYGVYSMRACKYPGWGVYGIRVFAMRANGVFPSSTWVGFQYPNGTTGGTPIGGWYAGWGFYYKLIDLVAPRGTHYSMTVDNYTGSGVVDNLNNC
jgi:hypothetical protein